MFRSLKLGNFFGIDVHLHWSFLLFLPLFVLLNSWGSGLPVAVYLAVMTAGLFGSVLLHEFGHALMARRFGIATRDITLYPIGGVARLERMSERPWEELCIAVAGPAVNVAIAAALGFGFLLLGIPLLEPLTAAPQWLLPEVSLLRHLMAANLFLALFNLAPAFPMDGGRVLRALLAVPLGHLRATEIAAVIGSGLAILAMALVLAGPLVGIHASPMLLLVAAFVLLAGQQELAVVRQRAAATPERPLDLVPATEPATRQPTPAGRRFSGLLWDSRLGLWVLWRDGRPVAVYLAQSE
jgi:Zn-dependent protease